MPQDVLWGAMISASSPLAVIAALIDNAGILHIWFSSPVIMLKSYDMLTIAASMGRHSRHQMSGLWRFSTKEVGHDILQICDSSIGGVAALRRQLQSRMRSLYFERYDLKDVA